MHTVDNNLHRLPSHTEMKTMCSGTVCEVCFNDQRDSTCIHVHVYTCGCGFSVTRGLAVACFCDAMEGGSSGLEHACCW